MNKQEQVMRLFEIMNEIRPEGKGKRPPHERKHHERKHHGEARHGEAHLHPSGKKLLCILLHEDKMNQRNIAGLMNISAQAVSDLVKKMENREFIRKEQGEINNENMISLTEKGREIAGKVEVEMKEFTEKLFDGFSDEELVTLQTLMEKLHENRLKISE